MNKLTSKPFLIVALILTVSCSYAQTGNNSLSDSSSHTTESNYAPGTMSKRQLNYKLASKDSAVAKLSIIQSQQPEVFGANIFSSKNNSFEPNLKIATPLNYIIGPEDFLTVAIYGKSLANWSLEVTPEGNINIPGIGLLKVASRTIEEATALIQHALKENDYAIGNGTKVQVNLGNIRSIHVILIGQVVKPGTYTLPSLGTVFNALYLAGGPNENGSLREIEIIRNSKIIRHLDVYDFLVKGDQRNNIVLQDQDIIRVPTYRTRIQLEGQVKVPALFEVLPGESLWDILNFAGGFKENAYTTRIKVSQISDQQRKITDVFEGDFKSYIPLRGDRFTVERIIDRYKNRVSLTGAVFKPGDFELENGMTLSQLIDKAAGIKEDAFTERGIITRLNPDNSTEIISFNVRDVLNKTANIFLKREDIVHISSKFELRDAYYVIINGSVRNPGTFHFSDNMKVEDLILKAGGLANGASVCRLEVARRTYDANPNIKSSSIANVYTVDIDGSLKPDKENFNLHPFDIVSVYSLPGYQTQKIVKIEGEVLYPGSYTLKNKNEKISDLVLRAGGITNSADVKGASLTRDNIALLGIDKNKADALTLDLEKTKQQDKLRAMFRDSTNLKENGERNNYIGIDLDNILNARDPVEDILLEDGDLLRIPKKQQIVRVDGQVLYPSAIIYKKEDTFNDFIINAGGYSPQAIRRRAYVLYANGTVRGTKTYLFIRIHPKIKPGCEIFVPKKLEKTPDGGQGLVGYTTGVAALVAITLGILNILHK